MFVILDPSLVILSAAKNLLSSLRINSVKNLIEPMSWKTEILRLTPQNDIMTQSLGGHESVCAYCGKTEHGHIRCPNGHYLCDRCHNKDAVEIIRDVAFKAQSKNPVDVAGLMMGYPGLPMLGCRMPTSQGGAFMAALRNEGSRGITNEDIEEVFRRTEKQAHGGYCGLTGVCGIARALGACFAVLTGSRCGTDDEQRATMELVTRISRAIADLTGPSCCKAYVWASLAVAVDYLKENFGITLDSEPVKIISSVKYGKRRVCITSNGKDMAAMVPLQDLHVLEALLRRYEDEIDARDAKIAVAEAEREGTVSLDELIAELGL